MTGLVLDDLSTDVDALDFQLYVKSLNQVIRSANTATPLAIGIMGESGSGKTSLMKMLGNEVSDVFPTIWFDAWKYQEEDQIGRAMLVHVLDSFRTAHHGDLKDYHKIQSVLFELEAHLTRSAPASRLDQISIQLNQQQQQGKANLELGWSTDPASGKALTRLLEEGKKEAFTDNLQGMFSFIERQRQRNYREQIATHESFYKEFEKLVHVSVSDLNARLIVFVDNLDRCRPEKALEILHTIEKYLNVPGCVFVIGTSAALFHDTPVIPATDEHNEHTTVRNTQTVHRNLMDKMIQLPFHVPSLGKDKAKGFIQKLMREAPVPACDVLFSSLSFTPRQIKRCINAYRLQWRIENERLDISCDPGLLAKIVATQQLSPALYRELQKNPERIQDVETYFLNLNKDQLKTITPAVARAQREKVLGPLSQFVGGIENELYFLFNAFGAEIGELKFSNLAPEELNGYFGLQTTHASAPLPPPPAIDRTVTVSDVGLNETGGPEERGDGAGVMESEEAEKKVEVLPRVKQPEKEETIKPEVTRADYIKQHSIYAPQLVEIPGGPFYMGSTVAQLKEMQELGLNRDVASWESPMVTVELSTYLISKYPITNIEYKAFIRDTDYKEPVGWEDGEPTEANDHPIVRVSWHDAENFCKWLSEKTERRFSLPTEAQWEKASRGSEHRLYPWGEKWNNAVLNSLETGLLKTTPVGFFSPRGDSPYGIADMAGNVWEWCQDTFNEEAYYQFKGDDVKDPVILEGSGYKVMRGGAFNNGKYSARCSIRGRYNPESKGNAIGFRVVMNLDE